MGSYLSRISTKWRAVKFETINNNDSSLLVLPLEIPTKRRAVQVKTINNKDSSLHMLSLEILQYISATYLPSDAAASLALCSHSMLNILGCQALRSLLLESHTSRRHAS